MQAEIHELIQEIHNSPGKVVIVTAGAGTQALAWLLGVAGASRTLIEAIIPYDESSFNDFLGRAPRKYVAARTAKLMAGQAVKRGRKLRHGTDYVVGLACSATIITDRPKKGGHRAHVATWAGHGVTSYSLHLKKGVRDRNGEEEMVSRLMLNALAEAYGIKKRVSMPLLDGDYFEFSESNLAEAVTHLFQGKTEFIAIEDDGCLSKDMNPPAVLAGSFNPLHEGHLELAGVASVILGQEVVFELTAVNADKPALNRDETLIRMLQFAGRYSVIVSNAPTFVSKSRLFANTKFVVGYDTAARLLQPRFYSDSYEQMLSALAEIRDNGCSFLVAGRSDEQEIYRDAATVSPPREYQDMFNIIPTQLFRRDISSTKLRSISSKR